MNKIFICERQKRVFYFKNSTYERASSYWVYGLCKKCTFFMTSFFTTKISFFLLFLAVIGCCFLSLSLSISVSVYIYTISMLQCCEHNYSQSIYRHSFTLSKIILKFNAVLIFSDIFYALSFQLNVKEICD